VGHIPDGLYEFFENSLQVLFAPGRNLRELTELARILGHAHASGTSAEEVSREIREKLPSLQPLASLLSGRGYRFLMLILTVLSIAIPLWKGGGSTTEINYNQVINQVYMEQISAPPAVPSLPVREATPPRKVVRNEPCWCGSGKKYKQCHGH